MRPAAGMIMVKDELSSITSMRECSDTRAKKPNGYCTNTAKRHARALRGDIRLVIAQQRGVLLGILVCVQEGLKGGSSRAVPACVRPAQRMIGGSGT